MRRVTAWVGAAVVLATLAGCGPASPRPGTAASSATSAPSPTPAPTLPAPAPSPTPPAAMADRDVAGAEAAARFMIGELYGYTLSSQDTAAWQAMSYQGCVFCQGVIDDVAADRDAGNVLDPGAIAIHSAVTEKLNPSAYSVLLSISQEPSQVWAAHGTQPGNPDAGYSGYIYLVMYQEGPSWFLRAGELMEKPPAS